MKKQSTLEALFEAWWRVLARDIAPAYTREYRFHKTRDWRFDFAWPLHLVACEVDGGRWKTGGGKHATPDDYFKIATAESMGWHVLRFSGDCLKNDPQQCIDLTLTTLWMGGAPIGDGRASTTELPHFANDTRQDPTQPESG